MDPQIEHLIVTLVIMAVIGGFAVAAYYFIMSTPAGQGLGKFLGGVGALLGSIGQQLETCAKVGYLNIGKGCWAGVLAIGIGALFIGATLLKRSGLSEVLTSKPPDKRINKMVEEGKDTKEIAKEITDEINFDALPADASPEVLDASITKSFNRAIRNVFRKFFRKIPNTPEQVKELNDIEMATFKEFQEDANDGLDSQEEQETNEDAENAVPETEPPIPEI